MFRVLPMLQMGLLAVVGLSFTQAAHGQVGMQNANSGQCGKKGNFNQGNGSSTQFRSQLPNRRGNGPRTPFGQGGNVRTPFGQGGGLQTPFYNQGLTQTPFYNQGMMQTPFYN